MFQPIRIETQSEQQGLPHLHGQRSTRCASREVAFYRTEQAFDQGAAQAEENLTRVKEEIEVRVQTGYNKLERTRQMVGVSNELLALRKESRRVFAQQLQEGAALRSQAGMAIARELEAKTVLLQSQLDYIQARDEMLEAMGQTPE